MLYLLISGVSAANAADVFITKCFKYNVYKNAGSIMSYYTTTDTDPTPRSNVRVTGAMHIQLTNDHDVAIVMGGVGATIVSLKNNGPGYMCGGAGNDHLSVGAGITAPHHIKGMGGNDSIFGGDGNDFLNGNAGNDGVHGGAGNDSVHGGKGSDWVYGDAGDDALYPELDNDHLVNGGTGYDICYTDSSDSPVHCEG